VREVPAVAAATGAGKGGEARWPLLVRLRAAPRAADPGSLAVVVGAGGGIGVHAGEGGEEHGAFELPVSASGCVFAVDRGARRLRGRGETGVGGEVGGGGEAVAGSTYSVRPDDPASMVLLSDTRGLAAPHQ
jgi:hypothetical protein